MNTKHSGRQKRRRRIRAKIRGTEVRPRVSVFRSNRALFVQFVDDEAGKTILGLSDRLAEITETNSIDRARSFGKLLAARAQKKNVHEVVFDRSGYAYHGRVKALAEGLREGGLRF